MLNKIICTLILVVLLPVSGLCAQEKSFFYQSQEWYGEWKVLGSTYKDTAHCYVYTKVPVKPESTGVAVSIRISDYKNNDHAELFVRIDSPSRELMTVENDKVTLFANYKVKPRTVHNMYFEKFENSIYLAKNLNPKIFLSVFTEAKDMTLLFSNGEFITLNLTGTSKAFYIGMGKCAEEYGKIAK